MIRLRYNNIASEECTIRPTPLVSISQNISRDGAGEAFGVSYTLTLTGTLLADQGSPYAHDTGGVRYPSPSASPNSVGPYGAFDSNISHFSDNRPPKQQVPFNNATQALLFKQTVLRSLFARDGQRFEVTDIDDDEPSLICFPRFVDINFTEGIYVDQCQYTVTLEVDTLLDKDMKVHVDGSLFSGSAVEGQLEFDLINDPASAFIQDYSNDWSLEVDDSVGESVGLPSTYRISHSVSATGKTHHGPGGKLSAWEQARKFVQNRLADSIEDYPNVMGQIGSGTVNLVAAYGGFNHIRTEQLSESAGSYSVTESWVLASGNSHESFTLSTSTSVDSPFVSVTIDGVIKGLSEFSPSGVGGNDSNLNNGGFDPSTPPSGAYVNALDKYHRVSNSGAFGVGSNIYQRANNIVDMELNPKPLSVGTSTNEYNGEVTYNVQFDDRPSNMIEIALSENISVVDTYPGDVFAIIPVLGRATGPVLQHIGGRTEYRRDVSIDLLIGASGIGYSGIGLSSPGSTMRTNLLLSKPSLVEPSATQLKALISELSPAGDAGVRKWFLSPPQENWSPKNGSYSLSLSWTYELDT
jgi:hypothetical protein